MRAIVVDPGRQNSARVADVPEPAASEGAILVDTIALGVCGTDREIVSGMYGEAPPGQSYLVLGHESLGRVREAPPDCGIKPGDHVVGIVRRPDPVPCSACAVGEWDMCRNGQYTERGIKARNGYGSERFRIEPEFAVKVDPALGLVGVLLEPTSIVAKAWDQVERIGRRSRGWNGTRVLITGAGPIGLLAALIGRQRGHEVHVFDRAQDGPKPKLVAAIEATFHNGAIEPLSKLGVDVVLECTGASRVVRDVLEVTSPGGIVCLLGVGAPDDVLPVDFGRLNRTYVLENDVVFGSVNANRDHYQAAAAALARADRPWLEGLITRRVPLENFTEALEHRHGDIKVVVDFTR
ncbi:MAG TPA: glucose 1-dehydrogenase [Xanthobacteraceae bacterium]|jgi:threonine dehydrogenase-like Zn-dependent dehydrogenase|nr:glucose 1-dehydrogenase [Xanthobacteraceae bacterium]